MKTKTTQILTALALTLSIAAFASFSQPNALADEENSADITMGGDCFVAAVIGGQLAFVLGGEEIVTVENNNHVILKCMGKDVPNDSGKTQVFRNFLCTIALPTGGTVQTTDTHAVVTKKGVSSLTCKFTY